MPIENEVKYLLRDPAEIAALPMFWRTIDQGYLPGDARIRRRDEDCFFTYKFATASGLIEIETSITKRDFDALWPHTTNRVTKQRASMSDGDAIWDLDVMQDAEGVPYIAMAECEMPEGWDAPHRIDPIIEPFILRAITREEQLLYTNVRLSDPDYARALYG